MRPFLIVLTIGIVIFFSCGRKNVPVISDRTNRPPAPIATTPTFSEADLLAGQAIYTTGKCVKCHEAKPVEKWKADQWKPILKSMIPKAKLDSLQKIQVTAYVNTHSKQQ